MVLSSIFQPYFEIKVGTLIGVFWPFFQWFYAALFTENRKNQKISKNLKINN
jgi:hypothetical protein